MLWSHVHSLSDVDNESSLLRKTHQNRTCQDGPLNFGIFDFSHFHPHGNFRLHPKDRCQQLAENNFHHGQF